VKQHTLFPKYPLDTQKGRIYDLLSDGQPRTSYQIRDALGYATDSGVTARCRELRYKDGEPLDCTREGRTWFYTLKS